MIGGKGWGAVWSVIEHAAGNGFVSAGLVGIDRAVRIGEDRVVVIGWQFLSRLRFALGDRPAVIPAFDDVVNLSNCPLRRRRRKPARAGLEANVNGLRSPSAQISRLMPVVWL